jgi:hypothetical protein
MSGQGLALFVGPAFLGVLRFESAAEHVFSARIAAAGKAPLDERLKVRRDVQLHGQSSVFAFDTARIRETRAGCKLRRGLGQ